MKNKVKIAIIFGSFAIVCLFIICIDSKHSKNSLQYCKEYVIGEGNIKGTVDVRYFENKSEKFSIGANKYGYAVLKTPEVAYEQLKKNYSSGINLIQKEFKLDELTIKNIVEYKQLGDQVTGGTSDERRDAAFVSEFLDVYENSLGGVE